MQYVKGEICGVENCRATQYYIEDGLLVCKNGHRNAGRVQVQEDEDGFGTQGRKTRRKRETRERVSRVLRGPQASELYLQAYQLILWNQCHWLVQTKGFPAELETLVQDLWALRLQLLKAKVEDISDAEANSHVFSSRSELGTDTEAEDAKQRKRKPLGKDMPTLLDTLGLCYLATLLLRLPVSLGDIHSWVVREEIPFIRAVRLLPLTMREKLPSVYLGALDTRSMLQPDSLHTSVIRLVTDYSREFGVSFPRLNHPLILFKYISELALPLDIYPVVDQLAQLIPYKFSFPTSGDRYRISCQPEPQLISLLIVAVKLCYPFDAITRCPKSANEPAALRIDWKAWAAIRHGVRSEFGETPGEGSEMGAEERDVFDMSEAQMDHYLSWYEKIWLDEEGRKNNPKAFPKQLLDMFPTDRSDLSCKEADPRVETNAIFDKVKQVQRSIATRSIVLDSDVHDADRPVKRPGSYYGLYRTVENIPPDARAFFEEAARVVGLSLRALVEAVFQTESRLQAWKLAERKMDAMQGEA